MTTTTNGRPMLTNEELRAAINDTHALLRMTATQEVQVLTWLRIHLDALLDEQRWRAKGIGTAPIAVAI